MFSATVFALLLGLPADTQSSAAVAREVPPRWTGWTELWTVGVSTGRSFYDSRPNNPDGNSMWQSSHRQSEIRVTRQGTPLVVGIALHRLAYPTGPDISAVGAGLVLGARHPLLSWLHVELDATLGVQRPRRAVVYDVYPGGMFSVVQSAPLELYARLGAGVALRVASWLDLPVRLNLHVDPAGENHYLGAASVGVRCLLP